MYRPGDRAWVCAPTHQADPYEYAEPKQILKELKSDNFWDKLEEKKWTERRDAVLLLKGLADTPRIAGGDYGDVIRELRKVGRNRLLLTIQEACEGIVGWRGYVTGAGQRGKVSEGRPSRLAQTSDVQQGRRWAGASTSQAPQPPVLPH